MIFLKGLMIGYIAVYSILTIAVGFGVIKESALRGPFYFVLYIACIYTLFKL